MIPNLNGTPIYYSEMLDPEQIMIQYDVARPMVSGMHPVSCTVVGSHVYFRLLWESGQSEKAIDYLFRQAKRKIHQFIDDRIYAWEEHQYLMQ